VDEFVCLFVPEFFDAVGSFYKDFSQTPDEAVIALLDQAMKRQAAASPRIGQVKSYEKSDLFS
jgi:predicted phosphoribosyltransferase